MHRAGIYSATREHAVLDQWAHDPHYYHANLGIATGEGVIALDIDPRHHGISSLTALEHRYDRLPPTKSTITGSGGQHLLFRTDHTIHNRVQVGGYPGLDVRGEHGYIVAPPSLHISGHRYAWRSRWQPIAALPDWLEQLIMQEKRAAPTLVQQVYGAGYKPPQEYWLERVLACTTLGSRNQLGFYLSNRLKEAGVSYSEAEAVLRSYAAQVPAGDHPYTLDEAISSLRSAYRK